MTFLILGLFLFVGAHSLAMAAPALRTRLMATLGALPYRGLHALVSAAGLALVVVGFGEARAAPVVLYVPPAWMRHVTLALMLPVFPLALAAYLKGGLRRRLKHPLLAAVKFWALAHLLSNGRLADVVLFGTLLIWAVVDRISMKRRDMPALAAGDVRPVYDFLAVGAGLALYALFVTGWHHALFGVSPLSH